MDSPYNPCRDGLPAKLWECLRRNPKFTAHLKSKRDVNKTARAAVWAAADTNGQNAFADIALKFLLPVSYKKDMAEVLKPQLNENTPWSKTQKEFRSQFEQILPAMLKSPFPLEEPPFALFEIGGLLWPMLPMENGQLKDWVRRAQCTWELYDVIAVPKFIRDSQQRKAVLRSIDEMVRVAKSDARYLKPNGRFLGAEAEWRAYLCVEQWEHEGYDRTHAINFTAYTIHGKVDAGELPRARNIKKHKHYSTVEKQVACIERCIEMTFPTIDSLLESKGFPGGIMIS
jgi:hypothetical protein